MCSQHDPTKTKARVDADGTGHDTHANTDAHVQSPNALTTPATHTRAKLWGTTPVMRKRIAAIASDMRCFMPRKAMQPSIRLHTTLLGTIAIALNGEVDQEENADPNQLRPTGRKQVASLRRSVHARRSAVKLDPHT